MERLVKKQDGKLINGSDYLRITHEKIGLAITLTLADG